MLLFTFYLVADGPKMRRAICSRLTPARQERVLAIWELAGSLGANMICWPGIEGYNNPFQTPYAASWEWFLDGLADAGAGGLRHWYWSLLSVSAENSSGSS